MADDPRSLRRAITGLEATVAQLARVVEATAGTTQAGQIQALATALRTVANRIQRTVATVQTLPVGSTEVTLTWPDPWPDTAYGVYPSIVSGLGALGSLHTTLKAGSKTVTNCVVIVANTGTATVGTFVIDAVGIRT